jgi:hypothetical protein
MDEMLQQMVPWLSEGALLLLLLLFFFAFFFRLRGVLD